VVLRGEVGALIGESAACFLSLDVEDLASSRGVVGGGWLVV
jgi:hypothetical protein